MNGEYWTTLDELQDAAGEVEAASDARAAVAALATVDRRSVLKLIAGSLAAGALAGCRKPVAKIIPYLNQPPEITPGVPTWYATTCHGCTAGCGALAKVMDGRPVKLEGNPDHPVSQGGLCAVGQAAVLGLYDSDRQPGPTSGGKPTTWDAVDWKVAQALSQARRGNLKVVVLTGTLTGPATRAVISDFLGSFPRGEHITYDSTPSDALRDAWSLAVGEPLIPTVRLDRADVIVSFGADFLGTWLSPVELTKQYSAGRDLQARPARMSRHFQFESRLSLTGSNADYRHAIAPSEQAAYVAALLVQVANALRDVGRGGLGSWAESARALERVAASELVAEGKGLLAKAAQALAAARGRSLVLSDVNDVPVQAAVLLLNHLLGNIGHTLDPSRPASQRMGRDRDLARLLEEMRQGEVGVLLIHGCNPAYTYPQADAVRETVGRVPCSVSFSTAVDETSAVATHHCPSHHPMESWGDAAPHAGRLGLFQPTIRPLYDTRAFEDSLLHWAGQSLSFHDYLRRHWQASIFQRQAESPDFQGFWDTVLQRGFVELSPPREGPVAVEPQRLAPALAELAKQAEASRPELEVEVYEPVALRDGTAANNPWLQELPDPITKITWDNCAMVSPALAKEKGLAQGQVIELVSQGRTVRVPIHLQPGQHRRTISIALGYGRARAGKVGVGVGADAYPLVALQDGRRALSGMVERLGPLGETVAFAQTQVHASMEGRPIVREAVYTSPGEDTAHEAGEHASADVNLWQEHEYAPYKWGLVIDLTKCTGCGACVVACDVENNVPVVGRDEVRRKREMHWLRIDRYYAADAEAPRVVHQPMLCQHCEHAPCETVCPVLATVHDDQGLNVQVYNRCVGTRYCANNCPYKVRRFNFFNHISKDLMRNLALNPDVTVRSRGVMEKCSLCLHRIQTAKIAARREGRLVAEGEVRTACEQSCPAGAITFGNLADPRSGVSRLAASPRAYAVLGELGRRPSVRYLAKVRNVDESAV